MFEVFSTRDLIAFTVLVTFVCRYFLGFYAIFVPAGLIVGALRERTRLKEIKKGPHNVKVCTQLIIVGFTEFLYYIVFAASVRRNIAVEYA